MPSIVKGGGTFANDATVGMSDWISETNVQFDDNVDTFAELLDVNNQFHSIRLVKNGVIDGNNPGVGFVTSSFYTYTFGGQNDLWGLTLTKADIEASNFGVVVAMQNSLETVITKYLKVTNFGFTLPADAIINGVEVNVKARTSVADASIDYVSMKVYYNANQCWASVIDLLDTWIKKHK